MTCGKTLHADCGGSPCGMIMHAVEHVMVGLEVLIAVHDKVGHVEQQILLNGITLFLGQRLGDTVVGHGGMYQPHTLVQCLPEQATTQLRQRHGVQSPGRIQAGIHQQHVGDIARIALVACILVGQTAMEHRIIVRLVLLMYHTATAVFRGRNRHGCRQCLVGSDDELVYRLIESWHLAKHLSDGGYLIGTDQQRRVMLGTGCCQAEAHKGQKCE